MKVQDGLVAVAEAAPASLDIIIIDAGSGDASQVRLCQNQAATESNVGSRWRGGRQRREGERERLQSMWLRWRGRERGQQQ